MSSACAWLGITSRFVLDKGEEEEGEEGGRGDRERREGEEGGREKGRGEGRRLIGHQ